LSIFFQQKFAKNLLVIKIFDSKAEKKFQTTENPKENFMDCVTFITPKGGGGRVPVLAFVTFITPKGVPVLAFVSAL